MDQAAALPEAWRTWLRHNLDRGCDREQLLERVPSPEDSAVQQSKLF